MENYFSSIEQDFKDHASLIEALVPYASGEQAVSPPLFLTSREVIIAMRSGEVYSTNGKFFLNSTGEEVVILESAK